MTELNNVSVLESIDNSLENNFIQNIDISDISNDKTNVLDKAKKRTTKDTQNNIMNYHDYKQNAPVLKKYKLLELKSIAKSNKLLITGSKNVLIERIENYFKTIDNVIKIQRCFRGHLVRVSFCLRGPAYRDIKKCVNESDGYTLEPLEDIGMERRVSIYDKNKFIYGFDIVSLYTVYIKQRKIVNPYNRETVAINVLNNILKLYRLVRIIYPHCLSQDEYTQLVPEKPKIQQMATSTNIRRILPATITNRSRNGDHRNISQNVSRTMNTITQDRYHVPYLPYSVNQQQFDLYRKIADKKQLPVASRIRDLFIEIDLLGNYTNSRWFSTLNAGQYVRYFRWLYSIWAYRGQMSTEVKNNICYLHDPFLNKRIPEFDDTNVLMLQMNCIDVMEHMVYCGIDDEYRKLGALHVLTALTMVSLEARNEYFWLYENTLY